MPQVCPYTYIATETTLSV